MTVYLPDSSGAENHTAVLTDSDSCRGYGNISARFTALSITSVPSTWLYPVMTSVKGTTL